jgi:hypothetical protein
MNPAGLGSSSLVAHVLPYPPPPHANSFVLGPAVINTNKTVVDQGHGGFEGRESEVRLAAFTVRIKPR